MKELNNNVRRYLDDTLDLMKKAHITLPVKAMASIYHHAGQDRVSEVGALMINVVNKEYCKSYVVMLPGQRYPNHYHRIKTETCYVLRNNLVVNINGEDHVLSEGEMVSIERGEDHYFYSENGVIFEELSTMYVPNDSIYLDEDFKNADYSSRRTTLNPEEWMEYIRLWKE